MALEAEQFHSSSEESINSAYSDADYKPSSSSTDDSEVCSSDENLDNDQQFNRTNTSPDKCKKQTRKTRTNGDDDKNKSIRTNRRTDKSRKQSPKKPTASNITVKVCKKNLNGKRKWDKNHYCLYCGKSNKKLSRHLERAHMDVREVAYAFSFPLGSKKRKDLLEGLRNKGDYKHNLEVLKSGHGEIVTWKQPSFEASVDNYLPCQYCYAMFVKSDLWKHQGTCRAKNDPGKDAEKKSNSRVQKASSSLLPISETSEALENVIHGMQKDAVSFTVRNDALICKYGNVLLNRGKNNATGYISQKMRELGRLVVAAKEIDKSIKNLEDLCHVSKFQVLLKAVKRISQFSPSKNAYRKASTAVKIGFSLKGVTDVLIGQTLENDDDLAERNAKKFKELLEQKWKDSVSFNAHKTMEENRWNKDDGIPLTKDVMILQEHLRKVEDEAKRELLDGINMSAYKDLTESLLSQVIVFNRRREGEASRLTLDMYMNANRTPVNGDIFQTLTPLEQELSKTLTRIEIRGKRGRKVPILLPDRTKASIDFLIEKRKEAGVPDQNPFVFARPSAMSNFRGCDCLRRFSEESKAENPGLLRSTKLRKQVATLCQLLNLDQQELEQVARFMGHDIRVHCDFYRQTDKTLQLSRISKLLFAMEKGTETIKGQNLNTLDFSLPGSSMAQTDSPQTDRPVVSMEPHEDDEGVSGFTATIKKKRRMEPHDADDGGTCTGVKRKLTEDPGFDSPEKERPQRRRKEVDDEDDHEFIEMDVNKNCESGSSNQQKKKQIEQPEGDGVSSSGAMTSMQKRKAGLMAERKRSQPRRRGWSEEEQAAVLKHLAVFIERHQVPGKADCLKCTETESALKHRTWRDVKYFVHNRIVSLAKTNP
ncbi:uncharacterized protein LOC125784483 [Astyanax mexicanus]|uniref:uncharacterized protein LOC125784483 n=1 Tax=Astyanax mexicanus TaxID=7994 RepID=UPI0020CB328F|nr:uncharacterized protein LOC125784483 [Astyanax mexicanus]XP_049324187.1 uncharacterized protein LOC125784483 [Astyanax mexicanus]